MNTLAPRIFFAFSTIFFCGCSSQPAKMISTVIERSEKESRAPSWLLESEGVKFEGDKISAVGVAKIPTNFSLTSGFTTAESSAKKALISELQKRFVAVANLSTDQADTLSNQTVALISSQIKPTETYWEKISVTKENSRRVQFTYLRLYTQVTLSRHALELAMKTVIKNTGIEARGLTVGDTENVLSDVAERAPASVAGSFTVQVYALSSLERASSVVTALKIKGLEAFYVPIAVNGQNLYRVEVGNYTSREGAKSALAKVKKATGINEAFTQIVSD